MIEAGPRHFEQTVERPITARATLDGHSARRRMVLGRQRHLGPATRPSRRCTATSTRDNVAQALGPVADCTGCPACRSTSSAAPGRSLRRCWISSASPSTTAASRRCGTAPATCRASGSMPAADRSALRAGVEYRDLKGRFDPDPIVHAGLSSDIPAQPTQRRLQGRRKSMREFDAPLCKDMPGAQLLELDGVGPLFALLDRSGHLSTHDLQGELNWKPVERSAACAVPMRKASARRRSANCSAIAVALRLRRSTIRARTTAHRPGNFINDATVRPIASPMAFRPAAATTGPTDQLGHHRRQSRLEAGDLEELDIRRRRQPVIPRLHDRDELVQHQGQGRDPGGQRPRPR